MPAKMARGDYVISTDSSRLDVALIHETLSRSYWSPGIPKGVIERAISNSLCFGIYQGPDQVGFARVVTDNSTFAYLSDVFVLEEHRGNGLATWLVETIQSHEDLQGLRRFLLATRDAHPLYERLGFTMLANPDRMMEIVKSNAYGSAP